MLKVECRDFTWSYLSGTPYLIGRVGSFDITIVYDYSIICNQNAYFCFVTCSGESAGNYSNPDLDTLVGIVEEKVNNYYDASFVMG